VGFWSAAARRRFGFVALWLGHRVALYPAIQKSKAASGVTSRRFGFVALWLGHRVALHPEIQKSKAASSRRTPKAHRTKEY
jgi:hypothetical protein